MTESWHNDELKAGLSHRMLFIPIIQSQYSGIVTELHSGKLVSQQSFPQVLGTFDSVAKTVKATLTESLVQILSPKRRVDILRDCMHAKAQGRPYVTAFCGVCVFIYLIIYVTRA